MKHMFTKEFSSLHYCVMMGKFPKPYKIRINNEDSCNALNDLQKSVITSNKIKAVKSTDKALQAEKT